VGAQVAAVSSDLGSLSHLLLPQSNTIAEGHELLVADQRSEGIAADTSTLGSVAPDVHCGKPPLAVIHRWAWCSRVQVCRVVEEKRGALNGVDYFPVACARANSLHRVVQKGTHVHQVALMNGTELLNRAELSARQGFIRELRIGLPTCHRHSYNDKVEICIDAPKLGSRHAESEPRL
jgi:hypothetical protein